MSDIWMWSVSWPTRLASHYLATVPWEAATGARLLTCRFAPIGWRTAQRHSATCPRAACPYGGLRWAAWHKTSSLSWDRSAE